MTSQNLILKLNWLFKNSTINLIDYNLKGNFEWSEKRAILTKTYSNFSGDIILKGSEITLCYKMQEQRFNYFIHHGQFYVRDRNFNEIGGIAYSDILLIDEMLETV